MAHDMDFGLKGFRPRRKHPRFSALGSVPGLKLLQEVMPALIPRSEWSDRIKELEAKQERISDLIDFPQYDQARTNFCWCDGPCQAANTAQRIAGIPFTQFSSASVACIVNGFQNEGGWGIDAVKFLAETGACSVDLWPNAVISRQYDNAASKADRANHRVLTFIDVPCTGLDAIASCLLQPWPCTVGIDAMGHEMEACDLVEVEPDVFSIRCRNSWNSDGGWGDVNKNGVDGFTVLTQEQVQSISDCQAIMVATAAG